MRKLLTCALLLTLPAVIGGCNSSGPQSSAELVAAYRAAQASDDNTEINRLIVWVEDVRPDLADPYEGGEPSRRLTRQAITWALVRTSASSGQTSIETIERPEEFQDAAISPQPLYWVRIAHHNRDASRPSESHRGCIELPIISFNGAHYFYGTPHCTVETTFDLAGMLSKPPRQDELEIPRLEGEQRLLVRSESAATQLAN
ncbi:hypothetical protein LOC68_23585 [Blastopirellula sp. JC732]|uniref:Lipoprotein n=1 Tax=Blastopirellula sediminis TaxID=2894196 RepID=A0A9X1MQB3_9BACT|nr:hypothetical protein [Blastopirellula sediminis]MCC9605312.1 hypothetical protein [Blastopirellula sediminis]MCC9631388.1 hypothetical protein [Blastopirellula sediminis]